MRVQPVKGAASYKVNPGDGGKFNVVMVCTEGDASVIQTCRTRDAALSAADRWQTKENKAVTKAARGAA